MVVLLKHALRRRACGRIVAVILALCATDAACCAAEPTLRSGALRSLYGDSDAVQYVCGEVECTLQEFIKGLATRRLRLAAGATVDDALLIEPQRKGRQYFSALYLLDRQACFYRLVFAPDVSASSLRLLASVHDNHYDVRSVQRDSADKWREENFSYEASQSRYVSSVTRCFADVDGKTKSVPCE